MMNIHDYLNSESTKSEREKFDSEYPSIAKNIKHRIYRHRDLVIYHMVIPSTKPGAVSYDVVVEVKTVSLHPGDANIEALPIRVFSNCPSFVFGHAYRLNRANEICDWLTAKLHPEALTTEPTKPQNSSLEKSLYMAIKKIHEQKLADIPVYKTVGRQVYSMDEIAKTIRSQDEIAGSIRERINAQRAEREAKAIEEIRGKSDRHRHHVGSIGHVKSSKTVKTVSRVKALKSTPAAKTTKSTKKI